MVIQSYINDVDKSLKRKTKARFCIIWHYILEYCKQFDIKENVTLGILLATYILEYSKKYNIKLSEASQLLTHFNKDGGPILSPEKWSYETCEKTCIAYYLPTFIVTAVDTIKNPFAISDDQNYNFDVLERKNNLFMALLAE